MARCRELYAEDVHFGPIVRDLSGEEDSSLRRRFVFEAGSLYVQLLPDSGRRLYVPDDSALRNAILFEEHDSPARGHPGQAKTLLLVLSQYYWRGSVRPFGDT